MPTSLPQSPSPTWTPEDYRRLLQHPDARVRIWACERIGYQTPEMASLWVGALVGDHDPAVRHMALACCQDPNLIDAVLAAEEKPWRPGWLRAMKQLGDQGSTRAHDFAIRALQSDTDPSGGSPYRYRVAGILARCPAQRIRQTLRIALEHQWDDGRASGDLVTALLEEARPDDVPFLVRTLARMPAAGHESAWSALAEAGGVDEQAEDALHKRGSRSPTPFDRACSSRDFRAMADLLDEHFKQKGLPVHDWLDEWARGGRPQGFRWRSLLAWQVASTMAEVQPEVAGGWPLATTAALVLQALVDQDDEGLLAAAQESGGSEEALWAILSSPRLNVLADVAERIAATGTAAVPRLVDLLMTGNTLVRCRSLEALALLARSQPEEASVALPAVVDLLSKKHSDLLPQRACAVLIALGPRSVAPLVSRFGRDAVYDSHATFALGEIPCTEALRALLRREADSGILDEDLLEALVAQGHAELIPRLEEALSSGDHAALDALDALETLGALHGMGEDERERWRRLLHASRTLARSGSVITTPSPGETLMPRPPAGSRKKGDGSSKKNARQARKAQARKNRKRK